MSAAELELVDELYAERFGSNVTQLHAPIVFGPFAVCQEHRCPSKAAVAIEIPGIGARRACGIHVDAALEALGVSGPIAAVITRISP